MKVVRTFVVAAVALAIGCSTLTVTTDYAPGTDFSRYKTFTIQPGEAAKKNAIVAERLQSALASGLAARGLTRVPQGGDLNVFAHLKLSKETQINTTGYGYAGWGGWGWGGYGYGGGGMQTTTVQEIPVGTVVIDLVDAKTNAAVWRGIAKDQISTSATPEEREKNAAGIARELFANFPPASQKK